MSPYHTATFQLLGTESRISATSIIEIERTERRLQMLLPPSVREWYSFEDAILILATHSNNDPPIPIHEFEIREWGSMRLLPFRVENQGVCIWSILLDGSVNPPVYVDVDSNGTEWQLLSPTFSAYVYAAVSDYTAVFGQAGLVQAQNKPLTPEAADSLAHSFTARGRTFGWPGNIQYRFAGKNQGILIWSADVQADWFVAAGDESSLESALELVWDLDGVGKSFYDCSGIGRNVLARIRGQA